MFLWGGLLYLKYFTLLIVPFLWTAISVEVYSITYTDLIYIPFLAFFVLLFFCFLLPCILFQFLTNLCTRLQRARKWLIWQMEIITHFFLYEGYGFPSFPISCTDFCCLHVLYSDSLSWTAELTIVGEDDWEVVRLNFFIIFSFCSWICCIKCRGIQIYPSWDIWLGSYLIALTFALDLGQTTAHLSNVAFYLVRSCFIESI